MTALPGERRMRPAVPRGRRARRWLIGLLGLCALLLLGYGGLSTYIAARLMALPRLPVVGSPADLGLAYRAVAFRSRGDRLLLRGWFIPGVLPGGRLSARRAVLVVHGAGTNRADPGSGLLDLSAALARHGFAVLAFDLRGSGQSAPAPLSMGEFEQRDVLGAVDYLRSGPPPYPRLGRPRAIGGWGVSMGAATLLLAAAREPAIRAVVADSAYADVAPLMDRELPRYGVPGLFVPGILLVVRLRDGIDIRAIRPVAAAARLRRRYVLFIHGTADDLIPPASTPALAAAARRGGARVEVWTVRGAAHGQAYHVAGAVYVSRVVALLDAALGPPGA